MTADNHPTSNVSPLTSHVTEDEINLLDYWMKIFEAQNMDDARRSLEEMIKVTKSKEGILSITVEDKDPKRAADLANALVEELDKVNKGIVTTSGRRMRVFVEERLTGVKVELTRSEEAIKAFQERNKGCA